MSGADREWSGFEIAIIGMAGRFPGAANLDVYWQNLKKGLESIHFFTLEEAELRGRRTEETRDKDFVPAHGVLDDIELFDAEFFGFSTREAEIMDPQHRLFLETVWAAIENAGYTPEAYSGLVGVYAGSSVDDYLYANVMQNRRIHETVTAIQAGYSNYTDFLATRVSYKLGLRGPSFAVQSACSTSLVAVNLGCQQLLSGACDMAVAGGVSITLPQRWGYRYQEGMILSPDGHCRVFDAEAHGCLKGDGVGVVIMKRLADAIEDGDTIDAVILGSATNNDGDNKVGYTAPGIEGQIDVIRSAQMMAEVSPDSITYVEAHGTGTPMGDPVEVSALTQVFRAETDRKQYCGLGSVKSNFGHLDAAAGIAGLIKVVLALKHRTLPPSLHYRKPNPQIDFSTSPFYVNDVCRDWPMHELPRRAGVSSFGIGGTNAHLILEEAPVSKTQRDAENPSYSIFPLSARSTTALDAMSAALGLQLQGSPELKLADIAYTLQQGRKAFDYRRVVIARTGEELIAGVNAKCNAVTSGQVLGKACSVIFLFTGQGSQYLNMARGLYEEDAGFRKDIDQCAELLLLPLKEDIRTCLYPASGSNEDLLNARLTHTARAQPAIFVVEYAIARYWMRMGIMPSALIGHSLGELTAACIAGVFSLEDALKLVALRGQLMQSMPPGAMAAVPLPPEAVSPYLGQALSLAAINAPSLCVVSGTTQAVQQLQARVLSDHGTDCRQLHTSHAFHSDMMNPVVEPFRQAVAACSINPSRIPIISTITGLALDQQQAQDPAYWSRNIRDTVQYSSAIAHVTSRADTVLLEVGPGNTLIALAKKQPGEKGRIRHVSSLRHPHQQIDDSAHLLTALGALWMAGLSVNWAELNQGEELQRVHLPSYPFARKRHWIEPDLSVQTTSAQGMPLQAKDIGDWFYLPSWKRLALPAHVPTPGDRNKMCGWLIFMDETGIAEQFIHRLQKTLPNSCVTCVRFAKQFAHPTENVFTIRPDKADDMSEVIAHMVKTGRTPDRIVHFPLFSNGDVQNIASESSTYAKQIQTNGFFSLMHLSQALLHYEIDHPVSLSVVTDRSQIVVGDEAICPDKVTAEAVVQILPAEAALISARFIDVSRNPITEELSHRDVCGICNEILSSDVESVVAYRHGVRWVRSIEKVRLEKQAHSPKGLRNKGVYLITGGFGGMGFTFARYLAETVQARLVLVGRHGIPHRAEWASWIAAQGESDPQSKRIRDVERLESSGAQVQVYVADIADEIAMEKVLAQAKKTFGIINGIIHAAGIPGGGVIATQDKEKTELVWAAKIHGTKVLLSKFRETPPDFIVLCSSLTSAIRRPGRVSYTAANLYLDAVAQQEYANHGLPVVSINWDSWSEAGMAVTTGDCGVANGHEESPPITCAQGIEVFKRVIEQGFPQVLVYTGVWNHYDHINTANFYAKQRLGHEDDALLLSGDSPTEQVDDIGRLDDDPRSEAEKKLSRIWKELLGGKRVGIHDNFFELGGDSVVSIQLVARARQVGIHLSPKQIFKNQTIAEQARLSGQKQSQAASREGENTVVGKVPLTPVQAWFFEQQFSTMNHWNLAQWVELPDNIDVACLELAVGSIMQHHDVLRARFNLSTSGWNQEILAAASADGELIVKDFSQLSAERIAESLASEVSAAQSSLNLSKGPLARFVLFRMPDSSPQRLLVVIHHLVVDLFSLQIMVEDIRTAYGQAIREETIQLPPKTSSYQRWAESIVRYAATSGVQNQLEYWMDKCAQNEGRLPRDIQTGANDIASSKLMTRSFTAEETGLILDRVGKEVSMHVKDVLIASLAATLTEWMGCNSVCVDLEGHGRNPFDETIDVSRTVGWFTSIYPVKLQQPTNTDPRSWITHISESLDCVPNNGFDYGVLRYFHPDLEVRESLNKGLPAEVVFLYQGRVHESQKPDRAWQLVPEFPDGMRNKKQLRPHLLDFHVLIASGRLVVNVGFSTAIHKTETISSVLDSFLKNVSDISGALDGAYAVDTETDLDLSLVDLDETDLAQLRALLSA